MRVVVGSEFNGKSLLLSSLRLQSLDENERVDGCLLRTRKGRLGWDLQVRLNRWS